MHFKCDQHFDVSTSGVHCREHCPLTGFGHTIAVYLGDRCTQAWPQASQPPTSFPLYIDLHFCLNVHCFTKKNKTRNPRNRQLGSWGPLGYPAARYPSTDCWGLPLCISVTTGFSWGQMYHETFITEMARRNRGLSNAFSSAGKGYLYSLVSSPALMGRSVVFILREKFYGRT